MISGITEKEEVIIKDILKKYNDNYSFYYYGSRVTHNFSKCSDLDILIKGKTSMPLKILNQIRALFDLSDLPFVVDLSDYHNMEEKFYNLIKDNLVKVEFEVREG